MCFVPQSHTSCVPPVLLVLPNMATSTIDHVSPSLFLNKVLRIPATYPYPLKTSPSSSQSQNTYKKLCDVPYESHEKEKDSLSSHLCVPTSFERPVSVF